MVKKTMLLMGDVNVGKTALRLVAFNHLCREALHRLASDFEPIYSSVMLMNVDDIVLVDVCGKDSYPLEIPENARLYQKAEFFVYMFNANSDDFNREINYFETCMNGYLHFHEHKKVFILVNKMDLIEGDKAAKFAELKEIIKASCRKFEQSLKHPVLYTIRPCSVLSMELMCEALLPVIHHFTSRHSQLTALLNDFVHKTGASGAALVDKVHYFPLATAVNPDKKIAPDFPGLYAFLASMKNEPSEESFFLNYKTFRMKPIHDQGPNFQYFLEKMTSNLNVVVYHENMDITQQEMRKYIRSVRANFRLVDYVRCTEAKRVWRDRKRMSPVLPYFEQ